MDDFHLFRSQETIDLIKEDINVTLGQLERYKNYIEIFDLDSITELAMQSTLIKNSQSNIQVVPLVIDKSLGTKQPIKQQNIPSEEFEKWLAKQYSIPAREYTKEQPMKVSQSDSNIFQNNKSKYNCSFCIKNFQDPKNYREHLKFQHSVKSYYRCPHCHLPSFFPENMSLHLLTEHRDPDHSNHKLGTKHITFKCPYSGKRFSARNDLTKHLTKTEEYIDIDFDGDISQYNKNEKRLDFSRQY